MGQDYPSRPFRVYRLLFDERTFIRSKGLAYGEDTTNSSGNRTEVSISGLRCIPMSKHHIEPDIQQPERRKFPRRDVNCFWRMLSCSSSVDTQPRTIASQVSSWIEYPPGIQISRQQVRGNNACNGNTKGPTITMLSSATQKLTQQL